MEEVDINLLPKTKLENLPVKNRLFFWVIKYGRVIVIVFQSILIVLLFYKLSLYSQINDLSDTIEQKVEIVKSLSLVEAQTREVQKKIAQAKDIKKSSFIPSAYVTFLRQNVPDGVTVEEIIIENGVLKISARSKYTILFGEMLENFASSSKTFDIILLGAKFGSESEDYLGGTDLQRFRKDGAHNGDYYGSSF